MSSPRFLTVIRVLTVAFGILVGLRAAPVGAQSALPGFFDDSFEGPSLNPFWTPVQQFGTVTMSTDQTRQGIHSAKFTSSAGGQRYMQLTHTFPEAVKGSFSIWFYDSAAGQQTLYESFTLSNGQGVSAGLGTQDFDAFCYLAALNTGSGSLGPNAPCGQFPRVTTTNVPRVTGWHKFAIIVGRDDITFFIDDAQVFRSVGNYRFDTVTLNVSGPYWRPDTVAYFDDFSYAPLGRSFRDGFEGPAVNPFWSSWEQNGTITTSSDRSHLGAKSGKFESSSGGQRYMQLIHSFATPVKGVFSIWFYDHAPGQETLYESISLWNSQGASAAIGTQDFDAFCYMATLWTGSASLGPSAQCGSYPRPSTTNVPRTAGWHKFTIIVGPNAVSFAIDNAQVFTTPGNYRFDTIVLNVSGPYWRPNTVAYFDDFQYSLLEHRDLAVDFGSSYGTWELSDSTWSQRHTLNPNGMVAGDFDGSGTDDVVASFSQSPGLWASMDRAPWVQLHAASPSTMVSGDFDDDGDDDLVCVFPGLGTWRWSNGVWTRLHGLEATRLAVGQVDGASGKDLIIDFPGFGVWVCYNASTWVPLHALSATAIAIADLDGNGQDEVVLNFAGYGLYAYRNRSSWQHLHGFSASRVAAGDVDGNGRADLVIDFGPAFGLWTYRNNGTWSPLHGFSAESITLADRDGTGKDEIVIDFGPAYGLWQYGNDSTWNQLHPVSPEGVVAGWLD